MIYFSEKKITDIPNNMDESQMHYSKLKKYDSTATGSNTLWFHLHDTLEKKKLSGH